ncbi:Aldo-keto reductase [Pyrenophora teres f. teres]|uniref:Aldo-keto reductase n=1 Tax=Pyrenophora teres f. teres TaxID=97479 RepID=A0A6S6VWN7_9PLEO|nr:Aldo-keto reductase [Pyrenophora teres f. teres]
MSKLSAAKLATVPETLHRSIQATSAEFRQLGRSGLRVSNPILGGLQIGSSQWFPWVLDKEKALPLLKYAYDKGINTWDTANIYSNGQSEVLMGKAMRKYNIPRRKLTLMTKCYRVWAPLAGGQLARAPEQNGRTLRSIVNKNGAFYHNDGSDSEEIVRRVCEVARRRGWPMSHVALAWLNRRVTAPIIGFSSAERIDEALAARGKVLTEEEERHLEEAYRPQDILGHA